MVDSDNEPNDAQTEVDVAPHLSNHEIDSDIEDPELGFENRHDDGEEAREESDWVDSDIECHGDDEELAAMDDMYGPNDYYY